MKQVRAPPSPRTPSPRGRQVDERPPGTTRPSQAPKAPATVAPASKDAAKTPVHRPAATPVQASPATARPRLHAALPYLLVLLATAAMLTAGFLLKEQCVDHNWEQPRSWFCYSDMGNLWGQRGFDHDRIPYLQEFNEYPAVVAGIEYLTALATTAHADWIHLNEAVLALCGLATAAFLVRMARPSWRPLAFALGTPLGLYAFHNWDLAAVLLCTAGLFAFGRARPAWSGALLALGFYAKVYPALFLPILGMVLVRQEKGLGRAGWRFGLGAVGTLAAVAAPLVVLAPKEFLATFLFHAQRGPTMESWWNALRHFAEQAGLTPVSTFLAGPGLAVLSNALILASLALFSWAAWRDRLHWLHACLGMLCAFLLFNQVMSVQYALWVLPFFALVRVPLWLVLGFFAADGWVYFTVFDYFGHNDTGHFTQVALSSLARAAAYIALLAWVLFRMQRPRTAAPAPASVPKVSAPVER